MVYGREYGAVSLTRLAQGLVCSCSFGIRHFAHLQNCLACHKENIEAVGPVKAQTAYPMRTAFDGTFHG